MNKERRDRIKALRDELAAIHTQIDDIEAEEREAFDNLPESLQDSARGEAMSTAADNLSEASGQMDEAGTLLETIVEEGS